MKSNLLGAYNTMIEYQQDAHDVFGEMSVGLAGDLMTEDMVQMYNHYFYFDYQVDNRSAAYRRPRRAWSYLYSLVGTCNDIIGKVPPTATDPALKGCLGEALALRAYAFHTLAQRFQQTYIGNEDRPGIPLTLTPNDDREAVKGRGTLRATYDKIIIDFDSAVSYLKDAPPRANKASINYEVAAGLFARALMTTGDYARAAQYAHIARADYSLMDATEIVTNGFNNIGNKEWMWGGDITGETTSMFASFFSHICAYDAGYGESDFAAKAIDARLYGEMSADDVRKGWFKAPDAAVNAESANHEENAPIYCNFKFKSVTGWLADYIFMRVSEMYLIEAEALAQDGKGGDAYMVLKELMDNRDPSWSAGKSSVTAEDVFLQKRIELWGEGHIFYDYLRLKKGIARDYEGTNHLEKKNIPAGDWHFIYQIPQAEIDDNSDLTEADQNPNT
jgi:hypothetical protein